MVSYIFCLLFLLTAVYKPSIGNDISDVYEFGANRGKVTFSVSGSIGPWLKDKITVIPIRTPDCTKIKYVRVQVENTLAPPYVKYDEDINSVIIKYRPLQYSISNYVVLVKTKKDKASCDSRGEKN